MSRMEHYKNLGGNSGALTYRIEDEAIVVRFREGGSYRYDYAAPGKGDVEAMKQLALAGRGLCTYINKHVRDRYSAKLD